LIWLDFGREAADGTQRAAGLSGGGAMGATPLEPQIGGKGGEIGGRFAGLTLPETGIKLRFMHKRLAGITILEG
jgi:hypothetical protein